MLAMLATGVAWIAILAALQVSAQLTLPDWVRARGLAAFVVVFSGGMALGAVLWGQVATRIGISAALTTAALGMLLAIALTWRWPLVDGHAPDFTPSLDWPAPLAAETPHPDQGPVLVTIEYRVDPAQRAEFVAAMRECARCAGATARSSGSCSTTRRSPRASSNRSWTSRGPSTCVSTSAPASPTARSSGAPTGFWWRVSPPGRRIGSPIAEDFIRRRAMAYRCVMKSFGGTPAGERLERIKASPRWAGERFRNLHPILPGLRDPNVPMPTIKEFLCGGERRTPLSPLPR